MPETQIGCKSPTTADPDAQWVRRSGFKRSSHTERLTYRWCQAHPRSNPHSSGKGLDLAFTGRGHDTIAAGAGDDFFMSGGLGAVASMQSEDPANQVPSGATWVQAGLGSWGLYNDSELGDLGGRLQTLGLTTAQGRKRPANRPRETPEFIANNDHLAMGFRQFCSKLLKLTASGARIDVRREWPRAETCRAAANDAIIRSAA